MSERIIRVCCAVIIENGRLLAARRGMNMDLPLKWELPGGKLEGGESAEEAVVRELEEELGIETKAEEVLKSVIHHYPDKTIELIPVAVRIISGEPVAFDHHEIRWIETGSLEKPDWADADRAPLEANSFIRPF